MKGPDELLKVRGVRISSFHGKIVVPPSKSYFQRALFAASLCSGNSTIMIEGRKTALASDFKATLRVIRALGTRVKVLVKKENVRIGSSREAFRFVVEPRKLSSPRKPIDVGGSGTSARFAISYACLGEDGRPSEIVGDRSLSKRPMGPLLRALAELGAESYSKNNDEMLPIVSKGSGIRGGACKVDGSISSQFLSSLLISCVRAKADCDITVSSYDEMVSKPYVEATLAILDLFKFKVQSMSNKDGSKTFHVPGNQFGTARRFIVPGDASSAASIAAAAIASSGRVELLGIDSRFPQADSSFWGIAEKNFGAKVLSKDSILIIEREISKDIRKKAKSILKLDLKNSPDLVPIVSGLSAALGMKLKITNIGHLRFKESDRIGAISDGLRHLGIEARRARNSLLIAGPAKIPPRKPILLDSKDDHRIMMAWTIASLSGRFGDVFISDPSCIGKSYPNFLSDIRALAHQRGVLEIIGGRN